MSKGISIGIDGNARKVNGIYIGVEGVARRVKAAWIGVDGVARKVYERTQMIYVNACKWAGDGNTSLARTGTESTEIGRSASRTSVRGAAMQFLAPSGGWSAYKKAVLYVYRTGGTANAAIECGILQQAYSEILYTTQFYYDNYMANIQKQDIGASPVWAAFDLTAYLPADDTAELGITLQARNSYCTVDGRTTGDTRAYIYLE